MAFPALAVVAKLREFLGVADNVELLKPAALAPPPEAIIVIPLEPIELKSTLECMVVTLRSPETEPFKEIPVLLLVIEALFKVDISMFRPSAAFNVTPPVLALTVAVTPVLVVWALMAVAICAPRTIAVDAVLIAPMSMLLILISLAAIALN